MAIGTRITAEEYLVQPAPDRFTELVRGEVVELNPTGKQHGFVVMLVGHLLNAYVIPRRLGVVAGADFGIVTERNPDSVRAPDVAFFLAGPDPREFYTGGYADRPPLLVIEIRSPGDSMPEIVNKAGEYFRAGVEVVVSLDPERRQAQVFSSTQPMQSFGRADVLPLPAPLSELRLTIDEWVGEVLPPANPG